MRIVIKTTDRITTTYTGAIRYERPDDGSLRVVTIADGVELAFFKPEVWLSVQLDNELPPLAPVT